MELKTLGSVELVRDGVPLAAPLAQPKRLALLAYLCLAAGPVRRAALVDLFWPDSDEERGRGALRQALHFLRKMVGADVIASHGEDAVMVDAGRLACDARVLLAGGQSPHDIARLYRGDFLASLELADASDELAQWVASTRYRLRGTALAAIRALRDEANPETALYWARRAVELDPDDEEAAQTLHAIDARTAPAQAQGPRISLAVLPLARDRAADPAGRLAYLCEGIADELHAALARRPYLRLASRGVSVGVARMSRDLATLRAGLDVDWVLDGALADHGQLVEVQLRLVALSSGHEAWVRTVRVRRGELAPLELAVSQALFQAAGCADCPEPAMAAAPPEAVDAYLRGRYHWRRRPRESAQALAALQEAIARAPGFALAQAALADVYNTLGSWEAGAMPGMQAFPRAQGAALAALCVDPRCAEAHTALAYSTMHYLWQWDTAASQFERAIALDPQYAHAHHWHSHYLAARGQVGASLASSLRALALDPLDQVINIHLAWHYWLAREPGAAIEQAARCGRLDPDDHWVHYFTALGQGSLGDAAAAVEAARRAVAMCPGSPVMLAGLGWAYAIAGEDSAARALSAGLPAAAGAVGMAYEQAVIAAALGGVDAALSRLEAAVSERSAWLAYAAVDPRLVRLREEPRFQAVLLAVGLADMSQ